MQATATRRKYLKLAGATWTGCSISIFSCTCWLTDWLFSFKDYMYEAQKLVRPTVLENILNDLFHVFRYETCTNLRQVKRHHVIISLSFIYLYPHILIYLILISKNLISWYPDILTSWYSHILIFPHSHILISSFPHILICIIIFPIIIRISL